MIDFKTGKCTELGEEGKGMEEKLFGGYQLPNPSRLG